MFSTDISFTPAAPAAGLIALKPEIDMNAFTRDIAAFRESAGASLARARASLSLRLLCGEDLDAVLAQDDAARRRVAGKLVRRLERERLRGLNGHWSYDLNRHIGLRQALEIITANAVASPAAASVTKKGRS